MFALGGTGGYCRDGVAFDRHPRLRDGDGAAYSAAHRVVLVATSVSAAALCGITVDLPLAWD